MSTPTKHRRLLPRTLIKVANPYVLRALPNNGNLTPDAGVFEFKSWWQPLGVRERQQGSAVGAIAHSAILLAGAEEDCCLASYAAPEVFSLHSTVLQTTVEHLRRR
jgi:hypothetical protein